MDHWVCDLALHTKLNALRATPIAPCNSLFIAKWHSMGWTEDRLINHSPIFDIFSFWLLKLLWDFPVANSFHFSGTHIREGNGLVTRGSESQSIVSDSLRPHGLYSPRNSPGQNTGVGSLSLLQGSSQSRDRTQVSNIAGRFFTSWAIREAWPHGKCIFIIFKKLDMDFPWWPYHFTWAPAKRCRPHPQPPHHTRSARLCRPAPAGTPRWDVPAWPVCFRDSRSHRASLRCVSAMRPSSSVQQACCHFSVWILLFPTELLRHVYTFKMGVLCLVCGLQIFPLSLCLAFIPILFKETFAEHFCIFFKFWFH